MQPEPSSGQSPYAAKDVPDRLAPRTSSALSWDIFCAVVDNFGDIGVCWRLARCLRQLTQGRVRLWVDDLSRFHRIETQVDPVRVHQQLFGIDIVASGRALAGGRPADVVIQGFGAALPSDYRAALARRTPAPVWIDLDYLSAESWIEEFHGRPSPSPDDGLVKWFFFPGFTPRTGGLLREPGLEAQRLAFLADRAGQEQFWKQISVPPPLEGEHRISLFAYPNGAAVPLLQFLAADPTTVWSVLVPEGTLVAEQAEYRALAAQCGEGAFVRPVLHAIPFLSPPDYDRLLALCDVNFVRGEDSFVRAQWASRPFVWQIYPQAESAHLKKLDAFLGRYTQGWPDRAHSTVDALWRDWNAGSPQIGASFQRWWRERCLWREPVATWPQHLARQTDLATRLAQFASDLLK